MGWVVLGTWQNWVGRGTLERKWQFCSGNNIKGMRLSKQLPRHRPHPDPWASLLCTSFPLPPPSSLPWFFPPIMLSSAQDSCSAGVVIHHVWMGSRKGVPLDTQNGGVLCTNRHASADVYLLVNCSTLTYAEACWFVQSTPPFCVSFFKCPSPCFLWSAFSNFSLSPQPWSQMTWSYAAEIVVGHENLCAAFLWWIWWALWYCFISDPKLH